MDETNLISRPTTVLVVEDEALILEMVSLALAENGFEVHAVSNAGDALRYLTGDSTVDVLFTDINLPGGMNGAELATRARQMRPEMPIVYASGRYKLSEIAPLVRARSLWRSPMIRTTSAHC